MSGGAHAKCPANRTIASLRLKASAAAPLPPPGTTTVPCFSVASLQGHSYAPLNLSNRPISVYRLVELPVQSSGKASALRAGKRAPG